MAGSSTAPDGFLFALLVTYYLLQVLQPWLTK